MKKDQKKKMTRATRDEQKRRHLAKQQQLDDAAALEELQVENEGEELLELALQEEDEPEEEIAEKNMDGMEYAGPTSWGELDQERVMREQAARVRETTWDVQDLVRNILQSPKLDAEAKSAAIQSVGSEFGKRVKSAMAMPAEDVKKEIDMDVLQIEAILAHDKRHTGTIEQLGDWISKKKLSYSAEQALSDEDFALVVEKDGKKVRKYPIHDKAHVRNALARAAQQIKAGGEGATDARAALPKIRAAAKKFGIETSAEKERSAILIEKDRNGDWRWVGWVSNNFIDWDGDILSKEAHEEYVDWLDKNSEAAPAFLTWHTPGTKREAPVDYWNYSEGFLIMSGKLTEKEAAGLLKAKTQTDLGMSHGTWVLARDKVDPRIITKYRMYEVSDLPLENAANPFTDFEILVKEVDMDKQQYLATLIGEDQAKLFLSKTGLKKKALEDAGVASKEKTEDAPVTVEKPAAATPEQTAAGPSMEAILKQVSEELDIDGLNETIKNLMETAEKVPVLEDLVKELSKSRDEQLAEMLTPPAARVWSHTKRSSQSNENVLKENDGLANQKPTHWLEEVTGVPAVATPSQ